MPATALVADAPAWDRTEPAEPGQLALIHGNRTLTWDQFNRATAAMAHRLLAADLGPGDTAALRLPNGINYLVCLVGCLRAGIDVADASTSRAPFALRSAADLFDGRAAHLPHLLSGARLRLAIGGKRHDPWAQVFDPLAAEPGGPLPPRSDPAHLIRFLDSGHPLPQ